MVVLITGDRNYPAEKKHIVADAIAKVVREHGDDIEGVEGGASGADSYARDALRFLQLPCHEYPARWSKFGRAAGPKRNREMLFRHPDIGLVLAFHDNLSESTGTLDMVELALGRGIRVLLYANHKVIDLEQMDLFES